jgi:hypothetical protein
MTKMGRPRIPKGKKRSERLIISLRPDEFKALEKMSKKGKCTMSDVVRESVFSSDVAQEIGFEFEE